MSNLREAAQQALDALNGVLDTYGEPLDKLSIAGGTFEALVCRDAITALRAALAQPEPSPGWCKHCRLYTIDEPLQAAQPEPAAPLCRTDGRCQYAIDHGAEGLGHCPEGKCAMPEAAPTVVEPVGWLEAPYGGYKQNPRYRLTLPPAALAWKIPLYTTPPRAALTDEELIGRAKARGIHDADAAICFGRAVEAALGHETNCMTKAREIEALRNSLAECVEDSEEVLATHLQAYGEKYRVQRADFLRAQISTARALLAGKAVTP